MTTFITYFVHGTTTDNEKGFATGQEPGELSKLGIQQSIELGKRMEKQTFDAVFCSDLKRAIDSAELAFGKKYQIIPNERLRECNYGSFTGKVANRFKDYPKIEKYIDEQFPGGGESYKDVEKRMNSFVKFLGKNYDGKHVAIVAHQAPQLALDVLLKGRTWKQAMKEDWRNLGVWKPGWKYLIETE